MNDSEFYFFFQLIRLFLKRKSKCKSMVTFSNFEKVYAKNFILILSEV